MKTLKTLLMGLALAFGLAGSALAQGSMPMNMNMGAVKVEGAWARSTASVAKNGAAYFTIVNSGKDADKLVAAASPVAATVQLHRTVDENGVMKMLPVASVPVKAGGTVAFKPGSYHVMLIDLKAPLEAGQSFPLTLTFEHAGKVEVTVKVMKEAPKGTPSMGNMKM
ncbi:MAG TPA: copper chaperone PCu(A)C [Alphaproteobacteria bacterium]|nr:copper chaperone PCu(A)C [Alphaproteobacteria bacterium]